MRRVLLLGGLVVMVFGLACLNYTVDGKADEHRGWAAEQGMPAPSESIFLLGLTCGVVGAGAAGFAVGRRAT
jgi:hypothetical protein